MGFESWDLVQPDGTPLVANASSRRSAIARALAKQEFPGDVALELQQQDDTLERGQPLAFHGWEVRNASARPA